jgi:hypothetical protein
VLAPLHAVERARGRWRLLLLVGYGVVLLVAGVLLWRQMSLRGLPDIGDPFDVEAFLKSAEIPDERNAFVLYRQAIAKLVPRGRPAGNQVYVFDWSYAEPDVRAWLEANRPALALWLEGTRRDDAVAFDPGNVTTLTDMSLIERLEEFSILAVLEASRRMSEGDAAGAWQHDLGVIRASQHRLRFAGLMQRSLGGRILKSVTPLALGWATDARVSGEMIRRAIADLGEAARMQAPVGEYLKADYVILRNTLRSAGTVRDLLRHARGSVGGRGVFEIPMDAMAFITREPERSERVFQHIYANWIREIQKPQAARVLFHPGVGMIPPPPSGWSLAAKGGAGPELPPEPLNRWLESSIIARVHLPPAAAVLDTGEAQTRLIEGLRLSLATELYRREVGRRPRRIKELVGRYIDRLPEEYAKVEAELDAKEAAVAAEIEAFSAEGE